MKNKLILKLSLLSKFSILNFVILATIAIILAWSLNWQLEKGALQVAVYEASYQASNILGPILYINDLSKPLNPDIQTQLDTIVQNYILSQRHIVRIKIWNKDGVVIYSDAKDLVGRKFPLSEELDEAFAGETAAEVSTLAREENIAEQKEFIRLLEVYHPIRRSDSSQILGVYEIYRDMTLIEQQVNRTRYIIFAIIGLGFLILYFSLFTIIRRASRELIRKSNDNERLYNEAKKNLEKLERSNEESKQNLERLRTALGTIIKVLVSAVDMRDPYTAGHQLRSADIARAIATEMGLPQETIDGIRMASSIHDIGKLSIPAEILSKPGKLSEIEFSLIKQHPRIGFEMLKDVESPWPLAEVVYQHHERMDGSGYPRNLKGDDILMEARIMAVADVVEAIASHRPYRPGFGIDSALNEIEKNRGIFYDNTVADACLRLFREKGYKLDEK